MIAPKIHESDKEERIAFIRERFSCKAPACGYCGSCNLPGNQSAMQVFADYIAGKQEFATISSRFWQQQTP